MNIGDLIPIGGSNIKSVSRGVVLFASTDTSKLIDISAVNMAKTIVLANGCQTSQVSGTNTEYNFAIELVDSTHINISRQQGGDTATVVWTVAEFNNVKSKQHGDYSLTNTTGSVSISEVNIFKSLMFYSFLYLTTGDTQAYYNFTYGYLNDATSLNFGQYNSKPKTIKWQVIEFN